MGWPVATEVSSASARRSKGLVPTLADAEADGSVTEPPKKAFTGMTSTATATANVSAKFLLVMVGFGGRNNRNGTGGARSTATPARYEIREYEKNEKNEKNEPMMTMTQMTQTCACSPAKIVTKLFPVYRFYCLLFYYARTNTIIYFISGEA